MQSPELFLPKINTALRELRGAARVLKDERIDAELLPIMRSLLLAEVVDKTWAIAIGGSQGAGKTSLISTMYGLTGKDAAWLAPNEGRGEKLPVLIQEDDKQLHPQGYIRCLQQNPTDPERMELVEKDIEVDDFVSACRGDNPHALLPVLKVPRKFFRHNGQSIFLLPGYESTNRDNKVWQSLMRQVLIGAAGCVIVTDETRLANQQQNDIVRDMLSNELRTCQPLVVVSKTEGYAQDPQKLQQIRDSAATVFKLNNDQAKRQVLCTGSDDPRYVAQWLPQLKTALHDLSIGGGETRKTQLERLQNTLSVDLDRVINLVHSRATLFLNASTGENGNAGEVVKNCLDTFDEATSDLREDYRKAVSGILATHSKTAIESLKGKLINNHEGFGNKILNCLDTVTETQVQLENDVADSWGKPEIVLSEYTNELEKLTRNTLGRSAVMPQLSNGNVMKRLGYVDADGKATESKLTNPEVQTNLSILLGKREIQAANTQARSTPEFDTTVKLLPAMGLEYARLASALPQLVGVDARALTPMPQIDVLDSAKKVSGQFSEFQEVSKSLLKGFSVLLAVDAADGSIDSIPSLLKGLGLGGTAAAGTAGVLASTVTGGVAIGFLLHTALKEVQRHDSEVRDLAHSMIMRTKEGHFVHFMSHFDDLMRKLRDHLKQSLRQRYKLDQLLMEQDRLAKALSDVHVLQRDALDALDRSGMTLQLFNEAEAT